MPMPLGGVNPDHFIFVPGSFQIKPGAKIRNDLFVGPGLGVGLQVRKFAYACQFAQPIRSYTRTCTPTQRDTYVLQRNK